MLAQTAKRGSNRLTDTAVRKAKAGPLPYKMRDGHGLYLFVTKAGGKSWRWDYGWQGKDKTLSLGQYPAVSIANARTARDEAKTTLRGGTDPSLVKRLRKTIGNQQSSETFKSIALEWHGLQKDSWTKIHAADVLGSLEKDVFPTIGAIPIRGLHPVRLTPA